MKKKQRNRVFELSWFDGRCPHACSATTDDAGDC